MEGDGVTLRDYVDVRCDELSRRLDESGQDREHIREGIGSRVTRTEYDLLVDRVARLESLGARLLGGLTVITILLALLGVVLRYVVG